MFIRKKIKNYDFVKEKPTENDTIKARINALEKILVQVIMTITAQNLSLLFYFTII